MRPAVILTVAALLAASGASAGLGAAPLPPVPLPRPARRAPPPLPLPPAAPEAPSGSGIAVLRAPGADAILIRAGTFMMGSDELEVAHALGLCRREPARDDCLEEWFATEYAPHDVYLNDFWIDRTEVTVARYRQCVEAGRCIAPPYASGGERFDRPELPVTLVTWSDAKTFCEWAGGRLPTEAEWERAARGATGRRYPWGNLYNRFLANHGRFGAYGLDGDDGFLELASVGSFPDGRTADGIEDLAGNAEEWVADWFAPEYARASAVNPRGPDAGDERVVRGGSYIRGRPWLRSAARWHDAPAARRTWRGFRCARDAR